MALKIREHPHIRGIEIYEVMAVISQFADDNNLFLSFDKLTIESVVSTLYLIQINIGLNVKYNKTKLYHKGSSAKSNAKVYTSTEFTWTNNPIEIFGVHISNDIQSDPLNSSLK